MNRSGPGLTPLTGFKILVLVGIVVLATAIGVRASRLSQNKRLAEDFVREAFRLEDATSLYTSRDWTASAISIQPEEAAVLNNLAAGNGRLADVFCHPELNGTVVCTLTTISPETRGPIATQVLFEFHSGLIRSIAVPTARPPAFQ